MVREGSEWPSNETCWIMTSLYNLLQKSASINLESPYESLLLRGWNAASLYRTAHRVINAVRTLTKEDKHLCPYSHTEKSLRNDWLWATFQCLLLFSSLADFFGLFFFFFWSGVCYCCFLPAKENQGWIKNILKAESN